MQQETKTILEAWLKKAGFHKLSSKDVWCESKVPNQKVVDLTKDPIWIGINSGIKRIEAEDSGIASIQDYKDIILKLYNKEETNNKKPEEAGSHKPVASQEVSPSPPIEEPIIPAPSSSESRTDIIVHPYICSACETGISAVQRSATVESCKRALCEACAKIPLVPNAQAKEELKAPETKPEPAKETKKKPAGKKKETPAPEPPTECKHLTFQWQTPERCICMDCGIDITSLKIQEPGYIKPQLKEQIKPVMCQDCGFELSVARALDYTICESCAEKRRAEAEKTIPLKPREGIKMNEKQETKGIVPAGKPGGIAPVMSDHERDQIIEKAKAQKALQNQGGMYSVSGKSRPDSAMVQGFANASDISTEILFAEQTKEYAHVVVRGHRGDRYVDDVVHHDYETEFQLQTMEIINKNPEILDHYEGLIPVIKEGAKIEVGQKMVDAKYHLIHTLLAFKTFSIRDATTKAMNRVQMKLLNQDARSPEEKASEQKERDLVEEKKAQQR